MKIVKYPNLVSEMARHGDTYEELAKTIGITYNSIWRRLTGRTCWNIEEIDRVCEHYKKTYEELFKN